MEAGERGFRGREVGCLVYLNELLFHGHEMERDRLILILIFFFFFYFRFAPCILLRHIGSAANSPYQSGYVAPSDQPTTVNVPLHGLPRSPRQVPRWRNQI